MNLDLLDLRAYTRTHARMCVCACVRARVCVFEIDSNSTDSNFVKGNAAAGIYREENSSPCGKCRDGSIM